MNSELNVDFSGILQEAERFDKKLKEIDNTAQQLGHTLRNALGNLDLGGLKSLKDNIERLGESKISLKVVGAEELTKMSSIIDTLISQVEVFSKGGVSVFNSKALYSDNNNVLELSASLERVDQKISKLKEAWKSIGTSEQLAASDELFKGFVSPTHKNGTEYKPESKTYQNAMREHLEAQARIAIEEKAILSESLNWAKMTEDEKAAYIQKKLNDIFKAEEQQAKRVRKEYSDTVNEMVSLMKQTDSLNKKNTDGSITPKINQLESRFAELNSKRVQLEQQYGEQVVDIAQKTNSKVLAIEANRILEKNKKEKEEREKWYSTSSGAMHKARMAESIGEKEDAMGYLKTAMKNTYSPELIDKLRDKYQELRIAVEEHKKALNGELSLQPTVRAEYMRLRKELDSVVESKEKLAKTQAYKSGDEVAKSDYNAMVAREEDIQAKLVQIRKNAQGQLDAVDREYESKRAQNRVKEYEKAEQQIANKQTVAPKTTALFDLEDLEKQKAAATEAVKAVEVEIQKLEPQLNAAIQERINAVGDISEQSKKEIAELQSQIANMRELAGGANSRQELMQYVAQIQELRNKIEAVKKTEAELLSADASTENSSVNQLTNSMDELYEKMRLAEEKVSDLDAEMDSKLESNIAVEEQIKKIEEWKVKIKELEDDFTRLNAAGKAFDSDGKLTAEGEDLTNRKTQLEEELKLMQMNAAEAKRYSDSIIAQEQREADLAIQEEQRTTSAKIAEYERLVREKMRLEKEAREQTKATSNESLPDNVRNDAQSTLNETITERTKVNDRLIELENELGDKLNSARQRRHSAELQAEIAHNNQLIKEVERAKRDREQNKQKGVDAFHSESPQQAIEYSKSTQSINEQIKALQYLKQARDNLTVSQAGGTDSYKKKIDELNEAISKTQGNLEELTDKHKDLGEEQSNLISISNSLESKLLTLFGIDAIKGYIQKIVDVRKEFEYQQKSLQVLLQSKSEADKLWGQTVDLALRSPMRVKELVTYTKQLAAYKIETDKLHDSTKRLADVSSGLGVDMQRLILAFGQVRAAEFLRGTELRQFTEAGIPMLEELAKYFSEIEGKVVTTGEVFERISKRAVLFSDVEEVFHRITNEGGTFYQMQEKQADTMHGTISNLHDQIDLMLNDIGASKQDLIMSFLNIAKGFIGSWRTITDQIFALGSAFVICKVASLAFNAAMNTGLKHFKAYRRGATNVNMSLVQLVKRFREARANGEVLNAFFLKGRIAIQAFGVAIKAVGRSLMSFIPFAVITAIMELIFWIGQADEATRSFVEASATIEKEVGKQLHDSVAHYIRLAETINDATTKENERVEALNELKRVFEDILPDHMLEAKYIAEKAGKWEEAKNAMKDYYSQQVIEQKKAKIEEVYGGDIMKNVTDLKMDISDIMNMDDFKTQVDEKYGEGMSEAIKSGMSKAVEDAVNAMKSGDIDNTSQAFWRKVNESLNKYTGKSNINIFGDLVEASRGAIDMWELDGITKNLGEIISGVEKYSAAVSGVEGFPDDTALIKKHKKEAEAYTKKLEELHKIVKDLKEAYSQLNKLQANPPKEGATEGEKASYEKRIKEINDKITGEYEKLGVKIPVDIDVSSIANSSHLIEQETNRVQQAALNNFSILTEIGGRISQASLEAQGGVDGLYTKISSLGGATLELANNGEWTGKILYTAADGSTNSWLVFANAMAADVNPLILQAGENAQQIANELDPTPLMEFTDGVIDSVAETLGLSTELFDNIRMEQGQSLAAFHQEVKKQSDDTLAEYLAIKKVIEENPTNAVYVQTFLQSKGYESVEEAKAGMKEMMEQLKAYAKILNRTGYIDKNAKKNKPKTTKKNKKTTKKTDDPAEALRDLLGDMYDSFQDFNEEVSADAANTKISEIYIKEFEKLAEKVKGFKLPFPKFEQGSDTTFQKYMSELYDLAKQETKKRIDDDKRKAKEESYIEDAKELNEATKEQIDLLFEEYEIYKELEKIGMSPAMAKGLFGISTTSLDDITQKLQELKNAGKFEGTNMAEAYEEYLQKIKDEETKQQQDRLKIYAEYAKKSVGERAKIELEYLNHMAEIEKATVGRGTEKDSDGHLQSVYDNATAKAIEERNAALQKLEWEEFQKSDMFLMLFEDLDGASEQLMQHTLDQLKNFKEQWADMPLEDVKAITDKINDLESALINLKNPWEAIKTINQNIDSITNGKSRKQVNDEAMFSQTEMNRNNEEIAQLQVIRDLMWNGKEIAKEQRDLILAFSPAWDGTIEALDAIILRKNNMNKGYMQTIDLARKLTQQEKNAIKAYNRQEDAYNEINSLAKKLYDASKELVELFVDEDSLVTVFADMGMNMASTVLDTLALQANIAATRVSLQAAQVEAQAFGLAMNSAAGIVGWIVMGIQLLSQVLRAVFEAHDKAKQKQIDEEIEKIEKLEKALEDLEERLESVYSMGQLNSAMRQTQTNIDKQIRSYEKMMRLEEQKKKTDKDQIKDWQESIDELREKRLELHKEMVESLGGDYDIRSVARDFVDAWIDAFKETGDGLKGLQENFKEFFLNILLEQAVMDKVGGFIGPVLDYINNVVLKDFLVTEQERNTTEAMMNDAMKLTDDYMKTLFGENGVLSKWIDDSESSLSGLQQGVQGVTEETAQIIEAYLNSIRFFIAQDNQNLAKLTDAFTNVDTPSPILSELRNQTELITTIKDALNSVIKTGGHTEGGAYIKVAL